MKPWRLTRRAEASLTDIANWTVEHFGLAQANKYRAELIERINDIAAERVAAGRSCAVLVEGVPGADKLRYSLIGRHYLIYRETTIELQIIDLVHGARDLQAIITELT